MSSIQAIPFGQADCFLISLDCKEGRKHVLIDGGTRKYQRNKLEEFLNKNNITEIDFLVVTHFHQDHIGFIPEITKKFAVGTALLPFKPEFCQIFVPGTLEMKEDLIHLIKIKENLKKKTKIFYNNRLSQYQSFFMGEYCFTVIFPKPQDFLPFTEMMMERNFVKKSTVETKRQLINGDSSVLLLTKKEKQLALFCGDCFEENFKDAYFQYKEEKGLEDGVQIVKLSHHGRNDKEHVYYTEEFLKKLHPKEVIITSDEKNIEKYEKEWKRILDGIRIHIVNDQNTRILIE
ncbi:MAG: MBL fold metallo-hydrolase [Thermoflexaceae bacterium]|nr:MBL fold metallo-hydrolase [Thermoflexaceae bacterium]